MAIYHWEQATFFPAVQGRFADEEDFSANQELMTTPELVDYRTKNYFYLFIDFNVSPPADGFITIVGNTEFKENVVEIIPYTTASVTAESVNAFQLVSSIKFSTDITEVSIGYAKQYAVLASDGGYTSHIVKIESGEEEPASIWSLDAALFDFVPPAQINKNVMYAPAGMELQTIYQSISTDLTSQSTDTPNLEYIEDVVGRFRLTVEMSYASTPNTVYWQVAWRSYF